MTRPEGEETTDPRVKQYREDVEKKTRVLLQLIAAEAKALHMRDKTNANPEAPSEVRFRMASAYRTTQTDRMAAVDSLIKTHIAFINEE